MNLTNEQIQYISNYIESKDIKWYELQLELTDHMVLSMEEFWEQNPDLSFEQVQEKTFKKIAKPELKAIEKERAKILSKELAKEHRKMIAEYLTFPKIVGSLVLVYFVYTISAYFVSPQKYIAVLFCSSLIITLPLSFYLWKNKEIDGKKFLMVNRLTSSGLIISFSNLGMSSSSYLRNELLRYQWLVLLFCCIWVFTILFSITAIYLSKKTIKNIKKQYQLT
ncbi:hypothetical protein [Flavobacterium sp.]|uniref:hypothetical protein n=1 Tax=Flavobacterium sp. TaxID=239 RepID=UPI002612F7C9|nr:hypothetical protein [Flavobacterium sp.]MDG2433102.1 hypothetical protein [Flavobacterium sp.]